MATDNHEQIYILRDGVPLGPYRREEAVKLLAEGSVDANNLVRIGLEGRVFPAQMLMQPSSA